MFYSDDIFDNRDIHSFITKQQLQDYVFQKSSKNLADYKDQNNHQISLNSITFLELILRGNKDRLSHFLKGYRRHLVTIRIDREMTK